MAASFQDLPDGVMRGDSRDVYPLLDGDNLPVGFSSSKGDRYMANLATDPLTGGVTVGDYLNSPSTPSSVTAVAAEAGALVYFNASSRAASYLVTSSAGATATGTSSPIFVAGTNGVSTTFTVTAISASGETSVSASSNAVTPTALPAALAGLQGLNAWWDASQMPVVANGTSVASWSDYSGNNYGAAQLTALQQPVYTTAANWGGGTTGRPAVTFDGLSTNGDSMLSSLTSKILGSEFTVFVVASKAASLNANSVRDQRILSNEVGRADRGWSICASDNTGSAGNDCFSTRGTSSEINATSAITLNTPYIFSVVTGSQVFLNGTRQAPQGFAVSGALPRNQAFALGAIQNNSGSCGFNGSIAEIQIWRGRLSNANRKTVQSYLATKYAMTAPATDDTI